MTAMHTCDPSLSVQLIHITHRYPAVTALEDVSFGVEPGTLFGILGPNGSGKTTLFRILSTLLHPSSGTACVAGHPTTRNPQAVRQHLGVIFQQPALDMDLTISENLYFHGALYGLHGNELLTRVNHVMELFSLTPRASSRVGTLSGGLQRRVDLARGLLHHPNILLLDEPTTGLDPLARREFWDALAMLRKRTGMTMLVATHLMEEAEACDRIAILHKGKLVAVGIPEELKAQLGEETLWIETPDPQALAQKLQTLYELDIRIVGKRLQISHPEAHRLLGQLYEKFGDDILSATIRRPTLEDVFMVLTGMEQELAPITEES